MAASLAGLSASVTRILYLTGFPKELKTKDIQAAFSDYDGQNGGFKIKWRDDTSLLIVFQDATVGQSLDLSPFKKHALTPLSSQARISTHHCVPSSHFDLYDHRRFCHYQTIRRARRPNRHSDSQFSRAAWTQCLSLPQPPSCFHLRLPQCTQHVRLVVQWEHDE